MLRMIVAAAEEGRACPSNEEFCIALGCKARCTAWQYLTKLEADRRIRIIGRGRDRIVRVMLTGKETAAHSNMSAFKAIEAAALIWKVPVKTITGKGRFKGIIHPRFAASLAAVEMGATYSKTGRMMGGRDHSTIVYAVDQAREMEKRDPRFAAAMARLRTDCGLIAA